VKLQGESNDLLDRLKNQPPFRAVNLAEAMDPSRFVGRAPQQVDQFISRVVDPIRTRYRDALAQTVDLKV
jgi:adenylosuccinate lyase